MVKIALDPAMYHATTSVADELRKAADLGYEFFWHRYPKADDAMSPRSIRPSRKPESVSPRWYLSSTGQRRTSRSARPRSATGSGYWRSPTASNAR
jgi:hypothetical protein